MTGLTTIENAVYDVALIESFISNDVINQE